MRDLASSHAQDFDSASNVDPAGQGAHSPAVVRYFSSLAQSMSTQVPFLANSWPVGHAHEMRLSLPWDPPSQSSHWPEAFANWVLKLQTRSV